LSIAEDVPQNDNQTEQKLGHRDRIVKESTEELFPRSKKRSSAKARTLTSINHPKEQQRLPVDAKTREEEQKSGLVIRNPSRSNSLSRADTIASQDSTQLQLEETKSFTRISSLGNQRSRMPPSRTGSFEDQPQHPNDDVVTRTPRRLKSVKRLSRASRSASPKWLPKRSIEQKQSIKQSPKQSPKENFQSPQTRVKSSIFSRLRKQQHQTLNNQNLLVPPSPRTKVNRAVRDLSSSKSIPSVRSEDHTNYTRSTTLLENSESSNLTQQQHRSINNLKKSNSLNNLNELGVEQSTDRGRPKTRRVRKNTMAGEILNIKSNSEEGPVEAPKRSNSLDQFGIMRLSGRKLSGGRYMSQEKKTKNSKQRKWLRKKACEIKP